MNRTLYNAAMEKVTMSEQCESRILEAAVNMTPTAKKKGRKIRFIPVLAAVLIIGTTTVAAEGAFSWIKNMFADDSFEITDEIVGMTGEMNNFSCESHGGDIGISPIGMIAEDSTIYCLLQVDKMPDNIDFKNLKLQDVYINDDSPAHLRRMREDGELEGDSFGYGMRYKDDNQLAIEIFPSYKAFSDGDKITIKFVKLPDAFTDNEIYSIGEDSIYWYDEPSECYADVSFDISMGEINYIEKTYDNYTAIHVGSSKMFIERLYVSPLRILMAGQGIYSDSYIDGSVQVTFKDGSKVTVPHSGSHSCLIKDKYKSESDWDFENPINPENISTVYINDVCLYDSSEE